MATIRRRIPNQIRRLVAGVCANMDISAHGEAVSGSNQGPVYTHHGVTAWLKTNTPGTLHAVAYCNIHGLWEGSKEVGLL
jgi:superoxide reductase